MPFIRSVFPYAFGLFFLVSALVFSACETTEAEPAYLGHDYFGYSEGAWLVYDVDSTVYDDFLGEVFHYQYQVKELNAGVFVNSQDEERMRLERFWREDDEDAWKPKNVWTSALLPSRAIKTEENIAYVKLTFPVRQNASWNGNAYNIRTDQSYVITHAHQPMEVGTLQFDSTVRVLQREFITLIGEELQYEIYATGVGMIYKRYVDLSKEIDGTIIRGVDYSYTLSEFGY